MEDSKETGDKKKINEDLVVFMRKRSDTETPRYTARLKTYLDFQQKRRRADDARHGNRTQTDKAAIVKKKNEPEHKYEHKEANERAASEDSHQSRRRHPPVPEEKGMRGRSISQSEPSDCGRRRRRRCRRRRRSCRRRRRRRRSCRRRRRRRRSCRRRRRRRRSCRRRRRRRSCRRRRRRRSCRRRRRRC